MVQISIDYTGDLRCTATHGPSGRKLETDAPKDNHGRGESFSPTDLVATALGTCMATILGIVAQRKGWDLSGLRVQVDKHMSADSPRRIAKLVTEIWIPLPRSADPEGLLERSALSCPVHHSLGEGVERPVVFHWRDA